MWRAKGAAKTHCDATWTMNDGVPAVTFVCASAATWCNRRSNIGNDCGQVKNSVHMQAIAARGKASCAPLSCVRLTSMPVERRATQTLRFRVKEIRSGSWWQILQSIRAPPSAVLRSSGTFTPSGSSEFSESVYNEPLRGMTNVDVSASY